jgi:hypothetical protein
MFIAFFAMKGIAIQGGIGLFLRPGRPASALARHVFQQDAIDGADGQAQFAAGAQRFNHRMHAFVAADDGIDRAGVQTQRAADAPVFVDKHNGTGRFNAIGGVQRLNGLAGDAAEPLNTFSAAGWLTDQGVHFAPGGIRKGAAGFDITFLHPKANDEFPISGEGVLIELVQAPPEVVSAFARLAVN